MGKKNIILLVGLIVLGLIIVIFFLSPSQQSSDLSDNINAHISMTETSSIAMNKMVSSQNLDLFRRY